MIIADSNIVIYAAKGTYSKLNDFMRDEAPVFSAVSYVEALGYHAIGNAESSIWRSSSRRRACSRSRRTWSTRPSVCVRCEG